MIARALRRLAGFLYRLAFRFDRADRRMTPSVPMLAVDAELLWRDVTPGETINERPTLKVKAIRDADLMETLTPVPGAYPELEWEKEQSCSKTSASK